MDQSKEYVRMCKKAKEIRKTWRLNAGDWLYSPFKNVVVQSYGNNQKMTDEEKEIWLFLPRQDQLQGMVFQEDSQPIWTAIDCFHHFCYPYRDTCILPITNKECEEQELYVEKFKSMEQLWLAFVMYNKYNKKWNGEDWIL